LRKSFAHFNFIFLISFFRYLWFHLSDNKEDNHRYSFPKHFGGNKHGRSAVAFVHDTGSGLGGGKEGFIFHTRF
jgi:hypothetical protein